MPKIKNKVVKPKTVKGVKKRVKITASGKVKFQRTGMRKLMSGKRGATRNAKHAAGVLGATTAEAKTMRQLAGV